MRYERCTLCNGIGLQLNIIGEPDECPECNGNTVVPIDNSIEIHKEKRCKGKAYVIGDLIYHPSTVGEIIPDSIRFPQGDIIPKSDADRLLLSLIDCMSYVDFDNLTMKTKEIEWNKEVNSYKNKHGNNE